MKATWWFGTGSFPNSAGTISRLQFWTKRSRNMGSPTGLTSPRSPSGSTSTRSGETDGAARRVTDPSEDFRYWAFISYSHADAKWGDRLHAALETYRLPSRLVRKAQPPGSVPRRVFPVFRDREELASSASLGENIENALRASRALIVICSPRAAASRW